MLQSHQLNVFKVDIGQIESLSGDFLVADLLIIAIPEKEISHFENLISLVLKSTIQKVIFISSTSVYSDTNQVINETHPTNDTALAHIEKLWLSTQSIQTTILRLAGLMGYDRHPGNFFKEGRLIDHPEGFVNMIHREDSIAIILQIIEKQIWGEVLQAAADLHPTRRQFYTWAFQQLNRKLPEFNEQASNNYKIISNEKVKKILGYTFRYPNPISNWP